MYDSEEKMAVAAVVIAWATANAAWITHVVVCIQSAQWILLAFGAVVAPIGVIHGIGQWFGVW